MTTHHTDTFGPDFDIEAVHNGYFTVENTNTGEWRTFRIRKHGENDRFPTNSQTLQLLVGPENTTCYKKFAFINRRGAYSFKCLRLQDPKWQAMCDLVHSLITEGINSRYYTKLGYVIRHSNRCFVCGRTLTTPESIDTGIGPVCAENMR